MQYRSTRGGGDRYSFDDVLLRGLAPDGGLFVPDSIPNLPSGWESWTYQEAMIGVLGMYGAPEPAAIVEQAVGVFPDDPAPLVEVGDRLVFELYWGPTLSFKDHALQLVARLLDRSLFEAGRRGLVLGATSGDTGSAAIHACRGRPNLDVVILFPEGRVTEFQRRQMTTVPDSNVQAVAVRGDFDDCQRLVKAAFAEFPTARLVAINSINWARIASQIGYYVALGGRVGDGFDLVVPTGNFGNVYSAWIAKSMGVPIIRLTIANNANHTLSDLVNRSGKADAGVMPTVAPSMDVAVPSNLERFEADLAAEFSAGWISDSEIVDTIGQVYADHGYLLDPHTSTAWAIGGRTRTEQPQVVVSTAHPAKFPETIAEATGTTPQVPSGWELDADVPERFVTINPEIRDLEGFLRDVL